jgi:hypothetical protein
VSTAVADQTEPDEASFTSSNVLAYVPAVVLLIAVGLLGKYSQIWWNSFVHQHYWIVTDIEYVLWAILIGLLVTNTIGLHRIVRVGVRTGVRVEVGIVASASRCTGHRAVRPTRSHRAFGHGPRSSGINSRNSSWVFSRCRLLRQLASADQSGRCAPSSAMARASRA